MALSLFISGLTRKEKVFKSGAPIYWFLWLYRFCRSLINFFSINFLDSVFSRKNWNQSVISTTVLTVLMRNYGGTVVLIPYYNQWKIPLSLPEDFDPSHACRQFRGQSHLLWVTVIQIDEILFLIFWTAIWNLINFFSLLFWTVCFH